MEDKPNSKKLFLGGLKTFLLSAMVTAMIAFPIMNYMSSRPPKFVRDEIRKAELLSKLKELGWTESEGVLDLPLDSAVIYLKSQPPLTVAEDGAVDSTAITNQKATK